MTFLMKVNYLQIYQRAEKPKKYAKMNPALIYAKLHFQIMAFGTFYTLTGTFANGINGVYYFGTDATLLSNPLVDFENSITIAKGSSSLK